MNIKIKQRRKSPFGLILIIFAMCGFSLYIILGLQDSARIYNSIQNELSKPIYSGNVGSAEFPKVEEKLNIPSWEMFGPGKLWTLVSQDVQLQPSYVPDNLIDITLPHGDSSVTMKIQSTISGQLGRLFADAKLAGYPLMVSSAYRSIADQQALYDDFVQTKGQAAADLYVAKPGSSEHHTGLAVDLSSASGVCETDSDRCSLDNLTSEWLADNAYLYGFINRYPEGKQPITGIPYEPWHYRYVGVPLASMIYNSGLTLDEALIQMRPAFAI